MTWEILSGSPVTYVNAYGDLNRQGALVASPTFPGSMPYNWTWSLEADRELNPRVMLRLSYISSRAYDQFIVNPVTDLATGPAMLLTPHGASRYHELESTVHIRLTSDHRLDRLLRVQQSARRFEHSRAIVCAF